MRIHDDIAGNSFYITESTEPVKGIPIIIFDYLPGSRVRYAPPPSRAATSTEIALWKKVKCLARLNDAWWVEKQEVPDGQQKD
jgi:hypothetical protein